MSLQLSYRDFILRLCSNLRDYSSADREKITKAIKDGRVAAEDVPSHLNIAALPARAQAASSSQTQPDAQTKKRKIQDSAPENAAASSSRASAASGSNEPPLATQIVAEQDICEVDQDEAEDQDEVYAAVPAKVVGVQYYTVGLDRSNRSIAVQS